MFVTARLYTQTQTDIQTHVQTYRHTDRQTDRQAVSVRQTAPEPSTQRLMTEIVCNSSSIYTDTDRYKDTRTDIQTDRQTDRQTGSFSEAGSARAEHTVIDDGDCL